MIIPAIVSTGGVLVLCVMSKLMVSGNGSLIAATDLVHQAVEHKARTVATSAERMEAASMTLALIRAARGMVSDVELERETGVDVARLSRNAESRVAEERQNCEQKRNQN